MTIRYAGLCALMALALPLSCRAANTDTPAGQQVIVGGTTEAVLNMQQSGLYAGRPQPLRGDIASPAYKRYLDTFSKPMPEFTETGSGSGAGTSDGSTQ